MKSSLLLQFDIQSEWHIGSGEEGGAYANALVLKDEKGLPYLPGRSIKGLLREAMQLAEDNGWFDKNITNLLFGSEGQGIDTQGQLFISNATLSVQEQEFLDQNSAYKKHLFRVIASTAIDQKSGVALDKSLRSLEVTVPMQLTAQLYLTETEKRSDFLRYIEQVLPLITHLGAKRNRGLGMVNVTIHPCGSQA